MGNITQVFFYFMSFDTNNGNGNAFVRFLLRNDVARPTPLNSIYLSSFVYFDEEKNTCLT